MRFSVQSMLALGVGIFLAPVAATAQPRDTTAGPVLTLAEAIALANRNNPQHLQLLNDRRTASAALRSAYGALLPSADLSFQSQYRKEGTQPFQGLTFNSSSDVYQSSYWLGLTYQINPATIITPRVQSANRDAVEAEITGSTETLRALVTQEYLTVLQSEARAALQDTLVRNAEAQLELARARAAVGSGTKLDVTRAEVVLGTQQVAVLQAHNAVEVDKLRLFQRMGVSQPANVVLSSTFTITPPSLSLGEVLQVAKQQNPLLQALRSREKVASLNIRRAQSAYLPTLSLSTGWGGYTYQYTNSEFLVDGARAGALQQRASCFTTDSIRRGAGLPGIGAACNQIDFTPAQAAALRAENEQYPFDFTRQPLSFVATVSVPIFDGFTREQRVQEAQAGRNDARYLVRARELQLTAEVTAAYLTLTTAARTITLQEQNAAKAREELRLSEERYRVGAATFIEITESRANYERAENDRINAIYEYHKAFAALESAVGRPMR